MFTYSLIILCFFFFFNDTATTEIYTLPLHDALPICAARPPPRRGDGARVNRLQRRGQEIDALQEERPLLGEEDGEALVGGDGGHVRLDLREVGIDGAVHRGVLIRGPLQIESAVGAGLIGPEAGAEDVRVAAL